MYCMYVVFALNKVIIEMWFILTLELFKSLRYCIKYTWTSNSDLCFHDQILKKYVFLFQEFED